MHSAYYKQTIIFLYTWLCNSDTVSTYTSPTKKVTFTLQRRPGSHRRKILWKNKTKTKTKTKTLFRDHGNDRSHVDTRCLQLPCPFGRGGGGGWKDWIHTANVVWLTWKTRDSFHDVISNYFRSTSDERNYFLISSFIFTSLRSASFPFSVLCGFIDFIRDVYINDKNAILRLRTLSIISLEEFIRVIRENY